MRKRTAVILNAVILILEIYGFMIHENYAGVPVLCYYTVLSNIIACVSSAVYLIFAALKRESSLVTLLRYTGTCGVTVTFFVVVLILLPMSGLFELLYYRSMLYHHLICPVLCVVSYLFFETRTKKTKDAWIPTGLSLAYGIAMVVLNAKNIISGPYPFFKYNEQGFVMTVVWLAVLFAGIYGISIFMIKAGTKKRRKD